MIVRSISVNQFRKFGKPTKVEGLGNGINIVAGPNEMGKSTLLAALRAAFFERHRSNTKKIRTFQNNQNKAAPVVSVNFEVDGRNYQITKRFIKSPFAQFRIFDGRTFEGDAAEEEMLKILNHDGTDHTRGSDTFGMWNVFWVEQGQSFSEIDLSEDARSSVQVALESEVGSVIGGKRGRELPKRFENQRLQYVTPRGRPTGSYKDIIQEVDKLNEELSALNDKQAELSTFLNDLESAENRLAELSGEEADEAGLKDLEEAQERLKFLDKLSEKIKEAEREIKMIQIDLDRFRRDADQLNELAKEIDSEKSAIQSVQNELRLIREMETSEIKESSRLENELNEVKKEIVDLELQLTHELNKQEVVRLHKECRESADRLNEYEDRKTRIEEQNHQAAKILVTDEAIERIRTAQEKLNIANAEISANSVSIKFDLDPSASRDVTVNDQALPSGKHEIATVRKLAIGIPRLGSITVEPATDRKTNLVDTLQSAISELKIELHNVGAESLEEATNLYLRRQSLRQTVESAGADLELYAKSVGIDSNDLGKYKNQIISNESELESKMKWLEVDEISELNLDPTQIQSMKKQVDEKKEQSQSVEQQYESARDVLQRHRLERTKFETKQSGYVEQIAKLNSQLSIAREQMSESELAHQIKLASSRLTEQQILLDDLKSEFSEDERKMVLTRIERLEKSINNRKILIQNLNNEVTRLKATIAAIEGGGIEERVRQKEYERDHKVAEVNRAEREVAVLDLILDTLAKAEKDARERFLAPILDRVGPYLRTLFPKAQMTMDEHFNIVDLTRDSKHGELFQLLSKGTQEQIAVLTRIAFAELFAEKGYPAVIVLDDALVFSDDDRMDVMQDILTAASRNIQIIILTCRGRLFEGLGDAVINLQTADPEQLRSA